MIKKFEFISGTFDEVYEYIIDLPDFDSWMIGKSYDDQVKQLLSRECKFNHIGPIIYQVRNEDGSISLEAAFVALTTPNRFLDDK